MKIPNVPGEFASKCLIGNKAPDGAWTWHLSEDFFFSKEEAEKWVILDDSRAVKWPVEMYDRSFVYVPAEGELI